MWWLVIFLALWILAEEVDMNAVVCSYVAIASSDEIKNEFQKRKLKGHLPLIHNAVYLYRMFWYEVLFYFFKCGPSNSNNSKTDKLTQQQFRQRKRSYSWECTVPLNAVNMHLAFYSFEAFFYILMDYLSFLLHKNTHLSQFIVFFLFYQRNPQRAYF